MTIAFDDSRPVRSFFFTVRLADPNSAALVEEVDLLRRVTRQTMNRFPFQIDEIVVLPNTLHTIWTLPAGDIDYAKRWRMLKSLFSRALPEPVKRHPVAVRRKEKGIWQRRFWDYHLSDAADYEIHRRMIYAAPLQNGLAVTPEDWVHSSIHRAIRNGSWPDRQKATPAFRSRVTSEQPMLSLA